MVEPHLLLLIRNQSVALAPHCAAVCTHACNSSLPRPGGGLYKTGSLAFAFAFAFAVSDCDCNTPLRLLHQVGSYENIYSIISINNQKILKIKNRPICRRGGRACGAPQGHNHCPLARCWPAVLLLSSPDPRSSCSADVPSHLIPIRACLCDSLS